MTPGAPVVRAALAAAMGALLGLDAAGQPARVAPPRGEDLRAVLANAQDVADGRRLAQDACARCHGASGVSATAGIPHIAGQRAGYLHLQLKAYRQDSRPQGAMTAAVKFLSDEALWKVAAYYASLDPAPRAAGRPPPTRPDPLKAGKAAAESCSGCHGENGVTSMAGSPSLVGLDTRYFVSAMAAYKTGARRHDLMKAAAAGLSEADFTNLALFYAQQKPAKAQTRAEGNAAAGKAAAAVCGGCHGEAGVSATAGTPSLAGQDAEYLVAATRAYKDGSRRDEAMKAPAEAMDDRTLKDVAAHYAAQAPQAAMVRKPLALEDWISRCDRCHGPNGNSSDPMVPAIAAQRADWLEQVLHAYRAGARKSPAMTAMSATLGDADVKDLAAHYSRQPARPVTYVVIPAK